LVKPVATGVGNGTAGAMQSASTPTQDALRAGFKFNRQRGHPRIGHGTPYGCGQPACYCRAWWHFTPNQPAPVHLEPECTRPAS